MTAPDMPGAPEVPDVSGWLTVAQVAHALDVPARRVRYYCRRGVLCVRLANGHYRIRPDALDNQMYRLMVTGSSARRKPLDLNDTSPRTFKQELRRARQIARMVRR